MPSGITTRVTRCGRSVHEVPLGAHDRPPTARPANFLVDSEANPGASWAGERAAWGRLAEQPAAASGAWSKDDTFPAKICLYETPVTITVRLKFNGEEVRCESEANVGFGLTRDAALVGKAQ